MRIGIFAKTFGGKDARSVLRAAADAGYDAVQYNMSCSGLSAMPDEIPATELEGVTAAAREAGLEIVALSGTYNMIHPDPAVRADGLRRLEVLMQAAPSISTRLITLCTGTRDRDDQWAAHPDNDTRDAWKDLLAEMSKAAALAERHGVRLGIEPELANVVNSAAKARRLIDELGSSTLRVVFDPANLFEVATLAEQRTTVSEAVDLLADRISLAHAKDRAADGSFAAAGTGVIDYRHYLMALKVSGFDGVLVTHGLQEREAHSVHEFLRSTIATVT